MLRVLCGLAFSARAWQSDDSFELTSFDTSSKLYNFNEVMDVESDAEGTLWISTRVGLVRFNPNTYDYSRIEQLEPNGSKIFEKNLFLNDSASL